MMAQVIGILPLIQSSRFHHSPLLALAKLWLMQAFGDTAEDRNCLAISQNKTKQPILTETNTLVGEPSFLKLYHGCFLFCFVFLTSLSVTFLCYSAFILATHGPRVAELPIAGSNAGARGTNKTTCSSQIPQLSSPSIAHLCTSVCKW